MRIYKVNEIIYSKGQQNLDINFIKGKYRVVAAGKIDTYNGIKYQQLRLQRSDGVAFNVYSDQLENSNFNYITQNPVNRPY